MIWRLIMLWLLKILIFGHVHIWRTDREVGLDKSSGSTGTRVYQHCTLCGDVRKKDLI